MSDTPRRTAGSLPPSPLEEEGGEGGRADLPDVSAAPDSGQRQVSRWLAGLVVAIPFGWLLALFFVPFLIVLKISLSSTVLAQPPYEPAFELLAEPIAETWAKLGALSLDNYAFLLSDELYVGSYLTSLRIALVSTLLLLLIGYPVAYAMARAPERVRPILLMLVVLPFWTSFLIRVYAWIGILKPEGLLSAFLIALGAIDEPLEIMNTERAVLIGIVYSYLPFMVLPLYASLERLDDSLLEAAADLGCPPWKAFWLVTAPLSWPGVVAGSFLCFIPIMGEFVIPDLLGGSETQMIGRTLWNEFFVNRDWPVAAAVAVVLLLVLLVPIVLHQSAQARQHEAGR